MLVLPKPALPVRVLLGRVLLVRIDPFDPLIRRLTLLLAINGDLAAEISSILDGGATGTQGVFIYLAYP